MSGKKEDDAAGAGAGAGAGAESFADLIGETKDFDRRPAQAKNPTQKPRVLGIKAPRTKAAFRFPDPNEPRLAAADGVSDAQLHALRRAEPEPEERIDLHGLRRDAAGRLIASRIASARARDLRCVVVIHGRGQSSEGEEAVLRDSLPGWLSKAPCMSDVLAFAPAPNRLGGEGAMLVLLRRPK